MNNEYELGAEDANQRFLNIRREQKGDTGLEKVIGTFVRWGAYNRQQGNNARAAFNDIMLGVLISSEAETAYNAARDTSKRVQKASEYLCETFSDAYRRATKYIK